MGVYSRRFPRGALLVGGCVFLFLLGEAFLQVAYRGGFHGEGRHKLAFRAGFKGVAFDEKAGPDGDIYYETSRDMREANFRNIRFRKTKRPGTFRVVFLGESAVWGANYQEPLSFPNGVKVILGAVAPGVEVEVLNCGLPGITSLRVLDLARAMADYSPDAYVVYMGNNEFFERQPLLEVHLNDWLLRFAEKSALYYTWLRWRYSQAVRLAEKYERVYRDGPAVTDFPAAHFGYFEHRLREIVRLCRRKAIAPLLCTVIVNEKDWPPPEGEGAFSRRLSEAEASVWQGLVDQADAAVAKGDDGRATEHFARATKIVSFAPVQYRYGQCLLRLKRNREALEQFQKAILLSQSRAKKEMNDIVRTVAREEGVPFCDLAAVFRELSGDGIIGYEIEGRETLDDDVHLSLYGQYLVAREIGKAFDREGVLQGFDSWDWDRMPSYEEYMETFSPTVQDLKNSYTQIAGVVIPRNVERGMQFVERALVIDPRDPRALLYKGLGRAIQGRRNEAQRIIRGALRINPHVPQEIEEVHSAYLRREGYLGGNP